MRPSVTPLSLPEITKAAVLGDAWCGYRRKWPHRRGQSFRAITRLNTAVPKARQFSWVNERTRGTSVQRHQKAMLITTLLETAKTDNINKTKQT